MPGFSLKRFTYMYSVTCTYKEQMFRCPHTFQYRLENIQTSHFALTQATTRAPVLVQQSNIILVTWLVNLLALWFHFLPPEKWKLCLARRLMCIFAPFTHYFVKFLAEPKVFDVIIMKLETTFGMWKIYSLNLRRYLSSSDGPNIWAKFYKYCKGFWL